MAGASPSCFVGGLLAVAVLVIVEPLLPKEGVRVDPNYSDSTRAA